MTNDEVRKEFESWYQSEFSKKVDFQRMAMYYANSDINEAWSAYQAAHASQQARIEIYKNTVAARESEISKLKIDLLDEWKDENDTVWIRPTSWAYAQVCRVKNEQQARIDALEAKLAEVSEDADGFGTEDEHWASSLEELAEQFLNSYEAGEIITVHMSKDLGAKDYKYCFTASGQPFLEAIDEAIKKDKQ